jgi:diketogulonate reductase-like aldo/keto reductase
MIDRNTSSSGVKHLETLKGEKPVVNQCEIHPWMQQQDITDYCAKNGLYMGPLAEFGSSLMVTRFSRS